MNSNKTCTVFHSHLWGLREKKYETLLENDIKTTEWQKLSPKSGFYFFIPRDERLLGKYETYIKITDIFPVNSVGIVTARDKFVINDTKSELINRINRFKNSKYSDDDLHEYFEISKKKGWSIRKAWNTLQNFSELEINDFIKPILYRPFDKKWIFYHESLVERSRKDVMRHMMQENLGIITVRQVAEGIFNHVIVTNSIVESRITLSNKGIAYIYPLYIYPLTNKIHLFSNIEQSEKYPNINPGFLTALTNIFNEQPTPESIFYYTYAVLFSNIYREKYAEFLKIDFPRVPFTKYYEIFKEAGALGKRLVDLHLLKSTDLDMPIAKFPVEDDNKIVKPIYDREKKRVYINENQYFDGVPQNVWEYRIGGYQVCSKWLKDRKGRRLSLEDIKHYCRVVTLLERTIEIQNEIDELYPDMEKNLIEF